MAFNFDANLNGRPFRLKIHKKTLQAIIADMMIVTSISFALDSSYISLIVISVLLDIVLFADLEYMKYYKNPLTISVIRHNIRVVKEAKESAFSLVKPNEFLVFLDIPVITFVIVILKKYSVNVICGSRMLIGVIGLLVGIFWLSIIYCCSNREPYKWNRKRIARDLGVLFFHVSDIVREIRDKVKHLKKLSVVRIQEIDGLFSEKKNNIFTDVCKGKRVILIQMESMQDYLIDLKINGQEVTPNLNQLMKENIRFRNMYFQTSVANTSDAELLSNNSLFPSADKPSCYEYQNNNFYALGERLKKAGYVTKGYHGNQASTWNRFLVYRQYGYDSFTDNSNMINDETYHLGLGDCSFFRQVLELEKKQLKKDKTFLFLITLSQHHPFKQFADYDFCVGKYEGTMFGNYLKSANYADKAIGELIERLKQLGIYDDTLLFMYGDHSGIPEEYWKDGVLCQKKQGDVDNVWLRYQKVAAVMHLPQDAKIKLGNEISKDIDKIVGQVDILPTLVNLLGLDDKYMLGEDMLDDGSDGAVILRDGTVIGSDFIHYVEDDYVYNSENKKEDISEEQKCIIQKKEKRLKASDDILNYNLIGLQSNII